MLLVMVRVVGAIVGARKGLIVTRADLRWSCVGGWIVLFVSGVV